MSYKHACVSTHPTPCIDSDSPDQGPALCSTLNHSLRDCPCAGIRYFATGRLYHTFVNVLAQVLIVSPLGRALHTAQLAFPDFDGPIEVEALATERVYLSAEVGKSPSELMRAFPDGR